MGETNPPFMYCAGGPMYITVKTFLLSLWDKSSFKDELLRQMYQNMMDENEEQDRYYSTDKIQARIV